MKIHFLVLPQYNELVQVNSTLDQQFLHLLSTHTTMNIKAILVQTLLVALAASDCDDDFDKCLEPYLPADVPDEVYYKAFVDCGVLAYSKASCKTDGSSSSGCVSTVLSYVI